MKSILGIIISIFCLATNCLSKTDHQPRTVVTIQEENFYINGEITLKGRKLTGISLEGLLPNSRMVQGIFDDLNPETRQVEGYRPMPILFNEDDHFNFDQPDNNMIRALKARASWGFFDFRKRGETLKPGDQTFQEGYQSIPVDWGINSQRKKAFFELLSKISKD